MADKIFGQGLDPIPLKLVQTPVVTPDFEADARPVQVEGLGTVITANKGAAVANATVAADGTSAGTQLNALLAALRAAGIIAT